MGLGPNPVQRFVGRLGRGPSSSVHCFASLAVFGGSNKILYGPRVSRTVAVCTFWTAVQMWSIFTQLRSKLDSEIFHQL